MKFKSMLVLLSYAFVASGTAYGMDEEFNQEDTLKRTLQASQVLSKQIDAAVQTFKETEVLVQELANTPNVIPMLRSAFQQNPELAADVKVWLKNNSTD